MLNIKNGYLVLILTILLIEPRQAYAYLDPGTGSLLIQMLIGGVVAALYTIKMYWYKIKSSIKNIFSQDDKQLSDQPNNNVDDSSD